MGERKKRHVQPWQRGSEGDRAKLDDEVSKNKEEVHGVRRRMTEGEEGLEQEVKLRRRMLRSSQAVRRRTLTRWETDWWGEMGREATEAARRNDQATLYQLTGELTARKDTGRKDGGQVVMGNIDAEMKGWKDHFEKISVAEAGYKTEYGETYQRSNLQQGGYNTSQVKFNWTGV